MQGLNSVKNKVREILDKKQLKNFPQIIVVTKTFDICVIDMNFVLLLTFEIKSS